ncbi:hypothetical protein F5I97DRAFT_1860166 [Phlebopus sp. FC_14]|nr:hypothetical protein F5I97DRAFT_1860166 [Phlebopus sp. FC_14]
MFIVTSFIQSDLLKTVTYFIIDSVDDGPEMLLTTLNLKPAWKTSLQSISIEKMKLSLPCHPLSMKLFMLFPNLRHLKLDYVDLIINDDMLSPWTCHLEWTPVFGGALPRIIEGGLALSDLCGKCPLSLGDLPDDVNQRTKTDFDLGICHDSPLDNPEAVAPFCLCSGEGS